MNVNLCFVLGSAPSGLMFCFNELFKRDVNKRQNYVTAQELVIANKKWA
jgi:hypothetical protein